MIAIFFINIFTFFQGGGKSKRKQAVEELEESANRLRRHRRAAKSPKIAVYSPILMMIKDQEGQDLQIRNIWSKYREYANKAYIFMI